MPLTYQTGTPDERFWIRVDASGDCWEWTGSCNRGGYGNFSVKGVPINAHRYAWSSLIGPIPPKAVVDHMCRNRRCVNPDHLRIVSQRENIMSGYSPKALVHRSDRCIRGHLFTPANTGRYAYGGRRCRQCRREHEARLSAERRVGVA